MNDVRLPIETTLEGDQITKVCVEDIYKIVNRVQDSIDKSYKNACDYLESIKKKYWPGNEPNAVYDGYLIVGKGVSKPCDGDEFNEDIGNNIAFMKAKLNANIKKHNLLCKISNALLKSLDDIDVDLESIDNYIRMDLYNLRHYNNSYLTGIENKLGV